MAKLTTAQRAALANLTEEGTLCLHNPWRIEGWHMHSYRVHDATTKSLKQRGLIETHYQLARLTEQGRAALKEASDGSA